jgi:hypothetical protein
MEFDEYMERHSGWRATTIKDELLRVAQMLEALVAGKCSSFRGQRSYSEFPSMLSNVFGNIDY